MAATKTMTIRVSLDGANDLRFKVKQTRANVTLLTEAFGEAHVIVPRNPWGRNGKPKPVKAPRKSRKATVATA